MKDLIKTSGFLLLVVILNAGCEKAEIDKSNGIARERFYYAFDEKVPLIPKPNTILVKYVEGTGKTEIEKSVSRFTQDYTIKWHGTLTAEISVSSQKLADELAKKLKQNNNVYTCQPFYTLKDGLDMGVTDEILVRFLPDINEGQITELQDLFGISLIKTTRIYQKYRVSRGADALEIANKIYESGLVKFSTANFISYGGLLWIIPTVNYFHINNCASGYSLSANSASSEITVGIKRTDNNLNKCPAKKLKKHTSLQRLDSRLRIRSIT